MRSNLPYEAVSSLRISRENPLIFRATSDYRKLVKSEAGHRSKDSFVSMHMIRIFGHLFLLKAILLRAYSFPRFSLIFIWISCKMQGFGHVYLAENRLVEHWSFIALSRLEFFWIAIMKWKHVAFLSLQCFLDVVWWMSLVLWWETYQGAKTIKHGHQKKNGWRQKQINKAKPLSNSIKCSKLLDSKKASPSSCCSWSRMWRFHEGCTCNSLIPTVKSWRSDVHGFSVSRDVHIHLDPKIFDNAWHQIFLVWHGVEQISLT